MTKKSPFRSSVKFDGIEKLNQVKGERILSIDAEHFLTGDCEILIETENFSIVIGATDLGAWVEEVKRKRKKVKRLTENKRMV